jgi:hypothetical protein
MTQSMRLIALVTLAGALTACGVQPDSLPRDVPVADRSLSPAGDVASDDASGESRVYLVAPGDVRQLRSVPRQSTSQVDLLNILVAGPTETESTAQLTSAIPPDVTVLAARPVGSVLYVDLSSELTELSGDGLILAVAQIVLTGVDIEGIETVQITVDGERFPWPRADGSTTTGLLRIYDYPGLYMWAQPSYPALPPPT